MPGKLSVGTAVSSIIASMIGAGIFLLPRAIGDAGWVCGFLISLLFGWVLFTMPALALAKCCHLCEELEWLQKHGFGSGNPYPGSAIGSRPTALSNTSSMPVPGSSSSAGLLTPDSRPTSRLSQLRQRRASQAMAAEADGDDVDGRTYPGSRPIVDSLITSGHVVERVVVSEIHTNYSADGTSAEPEVVEEFVEEEKTVFFVGDIAEVAVGRWCRYCVNILCAIYLLFAGASFILLLGDAVHQLYDNGRLLAAKSNADFAKVYLNLATEQNGGVPEKTNSLWIEAFAFAAAMMVIVQIPDVSYIARISIVGTVAAMVIVVLFFISPFLLHLGSENDPASGRKLTLKPPGFEGVWPQPLVASHAPRVSQVHNITEATPEQLDVNPDKHNKFHFVWQNHGPKMYEFKAPDDSGDSVKKVLSSLGATGFGYAFATLVPYIRADMLEPAKMSNVIWIATLVAAGVYALVAVVGLLASGQEHTLVGGSALEAMKFWETEVVPVKMAKENQQTQGAGGVNEAVERYRQALRAAGGDSPGLDLSQERMDKYLINDLSTELGQKSVVEKGGHYFLLFRNPAYFFDGVNGGLLGKATLMSFLMAVFLLIKLLISYPLTIWPVLQDAENMAKACCGTRRSRRGGNASPSHAGTRLPSAADTSEIEEGAPLLRGARGEAASNSPALRPTAGRSSVRVSTRRIEMDQDEIDAPLQEPPNSGSATNTVPLWGRILARVIVVAITYAITCVFACKRSRLNAVTGFAASVPGMIAMTIFPLVAQNLLEAKVRRARQGSAAGGDAARCCGGAPVAQLALHGLLIVVALMLVVYQCYMTAAVEIREGFSGDD